MTTASVRQLRNEYASLLREVERGHRVAITRRGRTVAVLTPPPSVAVDWTLSAAFALKKLHPMRAADKRALLAENKGRH